jgi:hypothetical protein
MNVLEEDKQSGVVSDLIVLGDIPLGAFRRMNNAQLNQAIHFVAAQLSRPSKTETSCSSLSQF